MLIKQLLIVQGQFDDSVTLQCLADHYPQVQWAKMDDTTIIGLIPWTFTALFPELFQLPDPQDLSRYLSIQSVQITERS